MLVKGDEGEEWEGKISAIKTTVEQNAKQNRNEQTARSKKIEQKINEMDADI